MSLSGPQESASACQQRKNIRSQQAVLRMARLSMARRELRRGPNQPGLSRQAMLIVRPLSPQPWIRSGSCKFTLIADRTRLDTSLL